MSGRDRDVPRGNREQRRDIDKTPDIRIYLFESINDIFATVIKFRVQFAGYRDDFIRFRSSTRWIGSLYRRIKVAVSWTLFTSTERAVYIFFSFL